MGTLWQIQVDADTFPMVVQQELLAATTAFDAQFSRFIATSEASKFRDAKSGEYQVTSTMAELLLASKRLEQLTQGSFNAGVGLLFETLGYSPKYEFAKAPELGSVTWKVPEWSILGNTLTIDGPIVFDLGGIGKGYWIDQLSQLLHKADYPYHLVDGGGDMMATTKQDGQPWRVAIEWPGKPDLAIGTVALVNQGLAVSDVHKRAWKSWHHLVNATTQQPESQILGCATLAQSAYLADQGSSGIVFGGLAKAPEIAQKLGISYLIVTDNQEVHVSASWSGELFLVKGKRGVF